MDDDELHDLIHSVSKLPCPICGDDSKILNASTIAVARSALFVTEFNENTIIGCPECIMKAANEAYKKCMRYGWWALPFGPIKTLHALSINQKTLKFDDPNRYNQPTPEFIEMVTSHAPKIKARINAVNNFEDLFS